MSAAMNNSSIFSLSDLPYQFAELFLSHAYGLFFIVGGIGNLVVFGTLGCIFAFRKQQKASSHILVYSAALTIADSLQLLFLPLVIKDILDRSWTFGVFLCKAFTLTDAVGKLFSPFVLTLLSFDRFIAVCFPQNKTFRQDRFARISTLVLLTIAVSLTAPLCKYTNVVHFAKYQKTICTQIEMPEELLKFSIYCLVIVGFLCPTLLMIIFYTSLAVRLVMHSKKCNITPKRDTRKIYITSALLVGFYIFCYAPYWLFAVVVPQVLNTPDLIYLVYVIHTLPYLNSAINPVFYALLNTELRRSSTEAMSKFSASLTRQYEGLSLRRKSQWRHPKTPPEGKRVVPEAWMVLSDVQKISIGIYESAVTNSSRATSYV